MVPALTSASRTLLPRRARVLRVSHRLQPVDAVDHAVAVPSEVTVSPGTKFSGWLTVRLRDEVALGVGDHRVSVTVPRR